MNGAQAEAWLDEYVPAHARSGEWDAEYIAEIVAGRCPTLCDDDCESVCHESHVTTNRKWHDEGNCPGLASRHGVTA